MKKLMLLLAMLAMALMVAVPAFAQDNTINDDDTVTATNTVQTSQTGSATATSGDANAAAGNQFSSQSQTASNEANVEQNVTQTQEAHVDQWGSSVAKGWGAHSGDVTQGAEVTFGDQSVSAEVNQTNNQDQSNVQISEDNVAIAQSEANATVDQVQRDIDVDQRARTDVNVDQAALAVDLDALLQILPLLGLEGIIVQNPTECAGVAIPIAGGPGFVCFGGLVE